MAIPNIVYKPIIIYRNPNSLDFSFLIYFRLYTLTISDKRVKDKNDIARTKLGLLFKMSIKMYV